MFLSRIILTTFHISSSTAFEIPNSSIRRRKFHRTITERRYTAMKGNKNVMLYRVIQKYGLSKRCPNTRQTSWLRYSQFSPRSTGWLPWATLKTLLNSSHVLLWHTRSAGAFAFTQTAYLLKLVIPTTNALPPWRLNVETKTKRTLHGSWRLCSIELTNANNLMLDSSHFVLNWRCCTAVRKASALAVAF